MTDRSRHPLFGLLVAQFLGAFNDNAFKYIILTLALRPIILETGGEGGEFQMASQTPWEEKDFSAVVEVLRP